MTGKYAGNASVVAHADLDALAAEIAAAGALTPALEAIAVITVASVAALKAIVAPAAVGAVRTLGYYAIGDLGGGVYLYNSADARADNGGTIIAPTAGAGRWNLILIDGIYNVRQFGAKGDGTTDDHPAFQATHDAIPFFPGDTQLGGARIYIPPGKYRQSAQWTLSRRGLVVQGAGGGIHAPTQLIFDAGSHGIVNTAIGNPISSYGLNASLQDLGIVGNGGVTPTQWPGVVALYCGICMTRDLRVTNVWVAGFTGDGVYIQSAVNGVVVIDPTLDDAQGSQFFTEGDGGYGGADSWCLFNVITQGNGRDGIHVLGEESNGGLAINYESLDNGRFGVLDQSQLSSTYINGLHEGNVYGSLRHIIQIASIAYFGGNLQEGNGAHNYAANGVTFTGPRLDTDATGFIASSPPQHRVGAFDTGFWSSYGPIEVISAWKAATKQIRMAMGGADATQTAFAMMDNNDQGATQVFWKYDDVNGQWVLCAGTSSLTVAKLPIDHSTLKQWQWNRPVSMLRADVAYPTPVIDLTLGNVFDINVNDGVAMLVPNALNPVNGQRFTVRIKNIHGAPLGGTTWDTLYKLAAWTDPGSTKNRAITFDYNANDGFFTEVSRTMADVPN